MYELEAAYGSVEEQSSEAQRELKRVTKEAVSRATEDAKEDTCASNKLDAVVLPRQIRIFHTATQHKDLEVSLATQTTTPSAKTTGRQLK